MGFPGCVASEVDVIRFCDLGLPLVFLFCEFGLGVYGVVIGHLWVVFLVCVGVGLAVLALWAWVAVRVGFCVVLVWVSGIWC